MKNTLMLAPAIFIGTVAAAQAGDVGHYNGGFLSIRDYFVPEPGVYGAVYNYYYRSDRVNDNAGNRITSIDLNPGSGTGLPVAVNVNLDLYAVAPVLIWVTPWQFAGAKYAAYISPSFADASLDATVSTARGRGGSVGKSSFGVGDLFVQPVWLGWTLSHWDFELAYGFYAPIGKYHTETFVPPGGGARTLESPDNIGLGFWTQQAQGGIAWYPWTNKATAVTAVVTYDYNGKKDGFDLTPGQNLTLNWGISQYLPLTCDKKLLLEVGPAGYDARQITDDRGSDANNAIGRNQVHAVGGQVGLTYVPASLALNFHGFYEYAAESRPQGSAFGINLIFKF